MTSLTKTSLSEGWLFARTGGGGEDVVKEGEWLATQSFPTTVHVELLKLGKIPDPVRRVIVLYTSVLLNLIIND
jgi:hypothetical protein